MIFIKISEFLNDTNPKYVDIIINPKIDTKRFVDIYTMLHMNRSEEGYEYKQRIIDKVKTYFDQLLEAIRLEDTDKLNYLSKNIHEAEYISLGYSKKGSGKGFGEGKFNTLVNSIRNSEAYTSGTISDILDVELYVKKIGLDILSDLITNLIQDVLSDYTEKKLNSLNMSTHLTYKEIHFWEESSKTWRTQNKPIIHYNSMHYLLVPQGITCTHKGKENLFYQIFNKYVYGVFKRKILSNPETYGKYIYTYTSPKRKGEQTVRKKKVAALINEELGSGCAKIGKHYLTNQGLLALITNYDEIKDFIESEIKKDF